METGKLIKDLRIKKGMTQEELADKTEVSARTIQRIEKGEVDPRSYTLQMIAKALEVDFSLFTEDEANDKNDLETKRTWLALIHLSGLLPLFFPTFIIWNRKKAEINEMTMHYRAVIAFQSTILFICTASLWAYYRVGGPKIFFVVLPLGAFFSIWNALKVLNGKHYVYLGMFKNRKEKYASK